MFVLCATTSRYLLTVVYICDRLSFVLKDLRIGRLKLDGSAEARQGQNGPKSVGETMWARTARAVLKEFLVRESPAVGKYENIG